MGDAMRTLVALAVATTAILGGCAQTPKPVETSALAQQDWILIAPPEDHLTTAFLETFEFLPDHKDSFPRSTNGLSEQEVRSLKSLFEQVAAEPSPEGRLRVLTESSDTAGVPVGQWREVRMFKSAKACESTRAELVKVTDEQTRKVGAYAGMPREEFQWPMLAQSFHASRCVPGSLAASQRAG
jgi:hypothetical protein